MKNHTTRNWIIAIVIILLILAVVYYSTAKAAVVNTPVTGPPVTTVKSSNLLDALTAIIKKFTTPKNTFVQAPPIDDQGCDANGYNAIGIKCL